MSLGSGSFVEWYHAYGVVVGVVFGEYVRKVGLDLLGMWMIAGLKVVLWIVIVVCCTCLVMMV